MNGSKAFLGGVVGGAVMSAIMWMARNLMGMEVHLEQILGTLFGGPPTLGKTLMGFVLHLVLSGMIALLYAVGFEKVTQRASAGLGVLFSLPHIVLAGIFMGYILPVMHPLVPEQMAGPGPFMSNLGILGVVAFVMLHLIYGAIVGAMYTTVTPSRP